MNKDLLQTLLDMSKQYSDDQTEFWDTMFGFIMKVNEKYFNKVNNYYNYSIFDMERKAIETKGSINELRDTLIEISTIYSQINDREKTLGSLEEKNRELSERYTVVSNEKESLQKMYEELEVQHNLSKERITAELRDKLKNLRDSVNTIPEYVVQIENNDQPLPDAFKKKLNSNIQSIYKEMLNRELWSEDDIMPSEIKFQEEKKLSIKDRKALKQSKEEESKGTEVVNELTCIVTELKENIDELVLEKLLNVEEPNSDEPRIIDTPLEKVELDNAEKNKEAAQEEKISSSNIEVKPINVLNDSKIISVEEEKDEVSVINEENLEEVLNNNREENEKVNVFEDKSAKGDLNLEDGQAQLELFGNESNLKTK
jgi:hypothetical protein